MNIGIAGPETQGSFLVVFFNACGDSGHEYFCSPLAASSAAEAWSEATGCVSEIFLWPLGEALSRYVDGLRKIPEGRFEDGLESYIRGWHCLADLNERCDELAGMLHVYKEQGSEFDDVPF